jgi:hypothetical protein
VNPRFVDTHCKGASWTRPTGMWRAQPLNSSGSQHGGQCRHDLEWVEPHSWTPTAGGNGPWTPAVLHGHPLWSMDIHRRDRSTDIHCAGLKKLMQRPEISVALGRPVNTHWILRWIVEGHPLQGPRTGFSSGRGWSLQRCRSRSSVALPGRGLAWARAAADVRARNAASVARKVRHGAGAKRCSGSGIPSGIPEEVVIPHQIPDGAGKRILPLAPRAGTRAGG